MQSVHSVHLSVNAEGAIALLIVEAVNMIVIEVEYDRKAACITL